MPLPDIPAGIEKQCNDTLNAVTSQLVAIQTAYANDHHGRYWQGLATPATPPKDGNKTAPDKTRKPTDQLEDWSAITLPATTPISVEVHVHDGPQGQGYTVFGLIDLAGRMWRRAVGVGAHSVVYDWIDVTPTGT